MTLFYRQMIPFTIRFACVLTNEKRSRSNLAALFVMGVFVVNWMMDLVRPEWLQVG